MFDAWVTMKNHHLIGTICALRPAHLRVPWRIAPPGHCARHLEGTAGAQRRCHHVFILQAVQGTGGVDLQLWPFISYN